MEKAKRFRAEVIEVYPGEGKAAVRFKWRGRERIECVKLYLGPECFALTVGMKGWAAYHMTPSMGLWGFEPLKGAQ
jgi:hypothetical protein